MNDKYSRRNVLSKIVKSTAALYAAGAITSCHSMRRPLKLTGNKLKLKGNIRQSVCRSTCSDLSIEELCILVRDIGFNSIDVIGPEDWPTLIKYGTVCSMCESSNMYDGWNHESNHASLVSEYSTLISMVSDAGFKNLMVSCGNREGMNDEAGLENCVTGIKKIIGLAEKKGVVLHMEMLNSKIDHKDYMADKISWVVDLCKRIGSDNFKMLFDIYHVQVGEGNIIQTILDNAQYIGHYHTGGVPDRHEVDETQELNYRAIAKAILGTGFTGYLAHEFSPLNNNPIVSLRNALSTCDI